MRAQAIPEIDRKAGIAGPQRVSPLPVARGVLPRLGNAVQGKRARASEPDDIPCPLVKLQECIAIAARSVAKIGALDQGSRRPDGLARRSEQLIERRAWQIRKTDDESGRAVSTSAPTNAE